MNVEQLIQEYAVRFKITSRNIEIGSDITEKSLEIWKKKYGEMFGNAISDYLLVFSYAKTGSFSLTGDAIYYDNFMQGGGKQIRFEDIESLSAKKGGHFSADQISVKMKNGKTILLDACIDGICVEMFVDLFVKILELATLERQQRGTIQFSISKQRITLCDLKDELKVLYLKILCNYAYIDDKLIDSKEYNAIGSFSIRMGLEDTNMRHMLQIYMNALENREKTGILLKSARQLISTETGVWNAFRYSLMQDALYIHKIQGRKENWYEDGFIGSLMENLKLCPEQMEVMVKAVLLNEKMMYKDANLKVLRKEWDDLLKEIQYTKGYVPSMYLFCSGSVYGIESYCGFLRSSSMDQEAINKNRELILHEIILNTQKTINILIGDMNFLADRLETELKKGQESKEKIDKLQQMILKIIRGAAVAKSKEEKNQNMLDGLPM